MELGLVPGWRVISDVADQRLRTEAIRRVLNEADQAALVQLIRLMGHDGADRGVHEQIMKAVNKLHTLYRQTEASAWQWMEVPARMSDEQLQQMIEAMGFLKPIGHKGFEKAVKADQTDAMARNWFSFLKGGVAAKVADRTNTYQRKPLLEDCLRVYRALVDHARAELLHRLDGATRATHELLARFDQEYQRIKLAAKVMRFEDVTHQLAHAEERIDPVEMYYRLDAQVAHLLLDEFQDTSLEQWRVLEPIADEVVAVGGVGRSLFCVGDVKQAIYGWRGGVAEIFDTLEDRWPHVKARGKNLTRRCSQSVVGMVNRVFTKLRTSAAMDNCREAAERWADRFQVHSTTSQSEGLVTITAAPRAQTKGEQQVTTLTAGAQLVKRIVDEAPGATVGVLVFRNSSVARLIYELRRPGIDIIASGEGGNPLIDSPAVAVVLSLLKMADHPGDSAARFHVVHSPLGRVVGLTDHRDDRGAVAVAAKIRGRLMTQGYGLVLYGLVEELAGSCEARDLSRLFQLVELGHAYDMDATLRPQDFVAFVENERVPDPTASRVRVMTVHQAKGLEFDCVVLPELDKSMGYVGNDEMVLWGREDAIGPASRVVRYPKQELRGLVPELEEMYEQIRLSRVQDNLSALYVALTRARYALHLVVAPPGETEKKFPCTYAGLIREAVGMGPGVEEDWRWLEEGDVRWFEGMSAGGGAEARGAETEREREVEVVVKRGGDRSRGLVRRTPSSLGEMGVADIERMMSLESGGRSYGSAMHAMFEQVEWIGADVAATAQAAAEAAGVRDAGLIGRFEMMLRKPGIAALLTERAGADGRSVEVLRERRFTVRMDGAVVSGAFDRLVVEREGDTVRGVTIIDYKTDVVEGASGAKGADGAEAAAEAAAVERIVARYRLQMEAYRRAAAAMYGVGMERVEVKLVLVGADRVVAM
jgi:ATP-dependent exoDNAse (exonuclease V) beta subunit